MEQYVRRMESDLKSPLANSGWSLDAWRKLLSVGCSQTYPPGVAVFEQGSPARTVWLIESGLVKLLRWETPETEVTVAIRHPGWPLGCEAAILGVPYVVTAETLTRCRISSMSVGIFLETVRTDENVSFDLHGLHAREIAEYVTHLGGLGALSTRDRLLRLIGEFLQAEGPAPKVGPLRLRMPVTYQELARAVVTTRQHLSRVFKELENDHLVRRQKGCLVIEDLVRFWSAIKQKQ